LYQDSAGARYAVEAWHADGVGLMAVYLLHFDQAIPHGRQAGTQHYLGFAYDVATRVDEHRCGKGARLTQVFAERGISFEIARVWPNAGRDLERKLKRRHSPKRLCPICRGMT
jgi:predicted GIY-YIG superfamily endonuclease